MFELLLKTIKKIQTQQQNISVLECFFFSFYYIQFYISMCFMHTNVLEYERLENFSVCGLAGNFAMLRWLYASSHLGLTLVTLQVNTADDMSST